MDFAPYQDASPETNRALSPPPSEGRRSFSPNKRSANVRSPPPFSSQHPYGQDQQSSSNPWAPVDERRDVEAGASASAAPGWGFGGASGWMGGADREGRLNEFETSLPIRLDYEACLAYLLLPPAGGVILLMLEWKSDYVRFHAWQSALLFSVMFVIHLIFSWSSFFSWILFIADLGLIGFLTMRAYRDADTLDRCEVPVLGALASRIVDDE